MSVDIGVFCILAKEPWYASIFTEQMSYGCLPDHNGRRFVMKDLSGSHPDKNYGALQHTVWACFVAMLMFGVVSIFLAGVFVQALYTNSWGVVHPTAITMVGLSGIGITLYFAVQYLGFKEALDAREEVYRVLAQRAFSDGPVREWDDLIDLEVIWRRPVGIVLEQSVSRLVPQYDKEMRRAYANRQKEIEKTAPHKRNGGFATNWSSTIESYQSCYTGQQLKLGHGEEPVIQTDAQGSDDEARVATT